MPFPCAPGCNPIAHTGGESRCDQRSLYLTTLGCWLSGICRLRTRAVRLSGTGRAVRAAAGSAGAQRTPAPREPSERQRRAGLRVARGQHALLWEQRALAHVGWVYK